MRLKKKIRRVFNLILWGSLVAGAGVLLGFADYEQNGTICRRLHYDLIYGDSDPLITEADVDSLIRSATGQVKGKPLYQVNTEKIERILRTYPYVDDVHVYGTSNGDIFIRIHQREPVIRIITENYKSYFIGKKGALLPFLPGYPVRVMVATGAIPDSLFIQGQRSSTRKVPDVVQTSALLSDLYYISLFVSRDSFLKAQIVQVYVNQQGEYELIPKVGNHLILLGNASDLEDKFNRLMVFYQQGLNQIGWNKYQIINIKYKNQVVCSKLSLR
ncbi:MAG: hypothetical protein JXA23_04820 [Bacteroidales bacterium]|nr:hypothetical protein [Bacteroidales bacterium]